MRPSCRGLAAWIVLGAGLATAGAASAQCMLANPSFELAGSGGAHFAGWNQFGNTGTSAVAAHGALAARASGPNTGSWDVSGFWQQMNATPGIRWTVAADVAHLASRPLTGGARAIVNVEWRDAGGSLITYESFVAADPATVPDTMRRVTFTSGPAPAGTVAARVLVGVLQGPGDPVPDVLYDHVSFVALTTPSLDQVQWSDFGGGRTVNFAGRDWRVKGPGFYGPGPNLFSNSASAVWVDAADDLHLTIQRIAANWYSTEVTLEEALGYGDYVFTTRGRLDLLDPHVVLGLFLWEYGPCFDPANGWWNPYNEIDIEFSRWGVPANPIAQYVAQPFDHPGNIHRFAATFATDEITSHAFRWLPDRVEYRSWRGGPADEQTSAPIRAWTYAGPHLPRPDQPRVHLNLWQFDAPPASNQDVVFTDFTFVAACLSPPCGVVSAPAEPGLAALAAPRPNPFTARTGVAYAVARRGPVEVTVHDLSGRRIRTLVRGTLEPGMHEAAWDGRDDAGARARAGVYFVRIQAGGTAGNRRVVLVR